ncbi:GntR family transcriptional regulator [Rhizobiales bacterium]|uniref:GntR family transcriptional regulator n=1 Tax=Hongsoonwoonella zoysiae TaxID=2821844 RepID=UPI0015616CDD|nr:GntR family transcriptional regulator [Hongsoonwoonella zoysiae]NRG18205.1 GntR family transcriptional regulator [Hongsoonwoonella zoysiae]
MTISQQDALKGSGLYDTMRRDIVFGRLPAGGKLLLNDLRNRYGVSISTIRECLSRLVAEGFVKSEGHRGFHVSPVTPEGLQDVAELRILLEGHALKRSLEAGDTQWEARIVAAHHKLHRMEQKMAAGDYAVRETWKQGDWEFHQSLISACGSSELMFLHGTVFDKYLRYQMRVLTFRGETAAAEHRQLLKAALERDADTAERILRRHIEGGVNHALENWQD